MSNVWQPRDITLRGGLVVPASQTDYPVSDPFTVTASGAKCLVICLEASAVTGTVDLKLQTSLGDQNWVDSKATTIAAPGRVYIKLMAETAADQTYLPLLSRCRLVATTGVGEDLTVTAVTSVQQV